MKGFTSVRIELDTARTMLEHFVSDIIGKGKKTLLLAGFSVSFEGTEYDRDWNPIEYHGFRVAYCPRSNYVMVLRQFTDNSHCATLEGVWNLSSDHDSCWRDCWAEILIALETKYSDFKITNAYSDAKVQCHLSIEFTKIFEVGSIKSGSYKDEFKLEFDDQGLVAITKI